MMPSPADAWLNGSAMDQGSAGKGSVSALPPRSKPRQSSSPASSVDRDGAPSIGRSGVKGGRTPRHASHLASLNSVGSSGGKFSFGKCMLSRGKTSPLSFMRVAPQQGHGGAATPNLILGADAKPNHQQQQVVAPAAALQQAESDAKDTMQCKDSSKAQPASQDLDLQHLNCADAVNSAITALTSAQRQSVQRLLCSPTVLSASSDSLDTLAMCPNLSFLILSLNKSCQSSQAGLAEGVQAAPVDLWPGLQRLMAALPHVVCLDISNCLMQDSHLQVIASSCPGLRALDVSYTPHVTSSGLGQLLGACSSLEELDISACPGATSDELLRTLAHYCPNLCSVYIEQDASNCASAASQQDCQVSCEALTVVAQGCRQLQVLSLAGLSISPSPSSSLQGFASACPQLVSLDLSACSWPAASDWQTLPAGALPTLQTLSLSAGPSFNNASLGSVAAACGNLTSLSITGGSALTDAGLLAAVAALSQLTELTLAVGPEAGDAAKSEQAAPQRDYSALEEALAEKGVNLVQPQSHLNAEAECDASCLDLAAMDLDAAASPAPRMAHQEGCEPEPMSISRSAMKPVAPVAEGAPAAAGPGEGAQPSWSSVMQFLTNHAGDAQMASCQKVRRPR